MTIAEKLYLCRKARGYSQEAMAETLGVSRQTVSKWETGETLPEIGKLRPLAEAFGVTTDWLLNDDEGYPYAPPSAEAASVQALPTREKKSFFSRPYAWIPGAVGIIYGVFLGVGVIPFFIAVRGAYRDIPDPPAMLKGILLVPVVIWIVALVLISLGIWMLVKYKKAQKE